MEQRSAGQNHTMSAIELISLLGFSFFLGWLFVTVFWLFCFFPQDATTADKDLVQLAAFAGIPLGLILLHALGKRPSFNPFGAPIVAFEAVGCLLLPVIAFASINGLSMPILVTFVASLMAGFATAACLVSHLDVLSRLQVSSYRRYTGISFVGGSLLFAMATISSGAMVPVFSVAYILFSLLLLLYSTRNADGNSQRAPLEAQGDPWKFTKEIEPSFFVFNIVFAFNFVFLFNTGQSDVQAGLLAIIIGALLVIALSFLDRRANITVLQRVLLVVTVIGCVAMPFAQGVFKILCACLVAAAWAVFKCVNYAFIVKKCTVTREAPFFRQAPARLAVSSLGFAVGWAIAAYTTLLAGAHAEVFTAERLVMAVVLVIVVMMFFPVDEHHPVDGTAATEGFGKTTVVSVQLGESELFSRRCEAVVKMYQLSPREADILGYLAKGRNAAWIQEELMVSPHTVKSHIYNIYKKLDIHSQQRLMDFVQEYPLDTNDIDR